MSRPYISDHFKDASSLSHYYVVPAGKKSELEAGSWVSAEQVDEELPGEAIQYGARLRYLLIQLDDLLGLRKKQTTHWPDSDIERALTLNPYDWACSYFSASNALIIVPGGRVQYINATGRGHLHFAHAELFFGGATSGEWRRALASTVCSARLRLYFCAQ